MRLGIIGLPQSGRTTIFNALTGARGGGEPREEKRSHVDQKIATVKVVDERLDLLTKIYRPKKTTYAQVEYLLPSKISDGAASKSENLVWGQVRVCDALIHVVRNFQATGGSAPTPEADYWRLEEEMILNDLVVTEKRIERIELDGQRGKKPDREELSLLKLCQELLEKSRPLRLDPELASAQPLRGFTFLSAKPTLLIINNDDEDESLPLWRLRPESVEMMLVRGRLEMDITSMTPEEAEEFLVEYHIDQSALDRVIKGSYSLLSLISFFTVLNEEVRAWTIKKGSSALEAAGVVHSDMQKGFIRAEILSFKDLQGYGGFREAKQAGHVRLEGKRYEVLDGDIINFRFNV